MNIELKVIGSGSSGNGYTLRCGGETLLIECGVPYSSVLRALGYDLDGVVGCVVTHAHTDHLLPKTASTLVKSGVPVLGCGAVAGKFRNALVMPDKAAYAVGGFRVTPLPVPHGGCECRSFVIDAADGQRILFATDLESLPYNVRGVRHLMIESNYSEDILTSRLLDNEEVRSKSDTHMEFRETLSTIERHIWSGLRTVTLIHLSRRLSDPSAFKSEVSRLLTDSGVTASVAVARAGMEADLCLYPWEKTKKKFI